MKSIPFSDILANVCQIVGLDRVNMTDKTFFAIRDLVSRRLGVIWDREEWPDVERFLATWPGNPVTSITFESPVLVTNTGEPLVTNTGELLIASSNITETTLTLDTDFPRVYLAEFSDDVYKKGQVGQTKLKIINGFYLTQEDGTLYDSNEHDYVFSYTVSDDANGRYITAVGIEVPIGVESPVSYGANGSLTPIVVFEKNPNFLVKLPTNLTQGLKAWSRDPRETTRSALEDFLVEDESEFEDCTFLRFKNSEKKWVKYRLDPPKLTGFKADAQTYYHGAVVYYDIGQENADYYPAITSKSSSGDFWQATVTVGPGTYPSLNSVYWKRLEIPARFRDYLINGTSSDFMRSEGRADEANIFESLAEASIQQQIDVLIRQQGQNMRMNMVYTY